MNLSRNIKYLYCNKTICSKTEKDNAFAFAFHFSNNHIVILFLNCVRLCSRKKKTIVNNIYKFFFIEMRSHFKQKRKAWNSWGENNSKYIYGMAALTCIIIYCFVHIQFMVHKSNSISTTNLATVCLLWFIISSVQTLMACQAIFWHFD